jgi:hypothetical protein
METRGQGLRTSGGTHAKQAVSPGISSWMWPDTASSDTPLSIHGWPSSLQACKHKGNSTGHDVAQQVPILQMHTRRSNSNVAQQGNEPSRIEPSLDVFSDDDTFRYISHKVPGIATGWPSLSQRGRPLVACSIDTMRGEAVTRRIACAWFTWLMVILAS